MTSPSQSNDLFESSWRKVPDQHLIVAASPPAMRRGFLKDVATMVIMTVALLASELTHRANVLSNVRKKLPIANHAMARLTVLNRAWM